MRPPHAMQRAPGPADQGAPAKGCRRARGPITRRNSTITPAPPLQNRTSPAHMPTAASQRRRRLPRGAEPSALPAQSEAQQRARVRCGAAFDMEAACENSCKWAARSERPGSGGSDRGDGRFGGKRGRRWRGRTAWRGRGGGGFKCPDENSTRSGSMSAESRLPRHGCPSRRDGGGRWPHPLGVALAAARRDKAGGSCAACSRKSAPPPPRSTARCDSASSACSQSASASSKPARWRYSLLRREISRHLAAASPQPVASLRVRKGRKCI